MAHASTGPGNGRATFAGAHGKHQRRGDEETAYQKCKASNEAMSVHDQLAHEQRPDKAS